MLPTVYVETSVISYYTARPSRDIVTAEALLYRLAAARLAEEKRFKRLCDGKPLPDDLEKPGEV